MTPASRLPIAAGLALAVILLGAQVSLATTIPDATYKGKARGDGDKVKFTTSPEGDQIWDLEIKFDSRCRQSGNNYTNENVALFFNIVKVRPSGKFKAKDDRDYQGGHDKSIAKGRFSADGKTAKGRFSNDSTFDPGGIGRVECHSEGKFKARTKEKPPPGGGVGGEDEIPLGVWNGETAAGEPLRFYTERGGVREFEFTVDVQCIRDGFGPEDAFTDQHFGFVERMDVDGAGFAGAEGPDHVSGSFDGRQASGTLSVDAYRDEFEVANCGPSGDVPFTARLETRR
jgi:hypothetical protein